MALGISILCLVLVVLGTAGRSQRSRWIREIHTQQNLLERSRQQARIYSDRLEGFAPLLSSLTLEIDPDGIVEFISGWPGRTVLVNSTGKSIYSFLVQDEEPGLRAAFSEILAGKSMIQRDCAFLLPEGGSLPIRLIAAPRRQGPTEPIDGVRVVLRDISPELDSRRALDRKKILEKTTTSILRSFVRVSEENLEETMGKALASLEKLTTVDRCHLVLVAEDQDSIQWELQWCAQGVKPVDPEGLPSSLSQLGWFKEKIRQDDILYLKSLEQLPPTAASDRAILSQVGIGSLIIFPLFRQKGVLGFLVISAVDRPGNWEGDSIRVLGILADALGAAVQRRETEKALRAANHKLHNIISFLPDPTFVVDSEHKVVAWNRAMEELSGVPADKMLGRGDYAYAVPFYGEAMPVLIDHFGDVDPGRLRQLYNFVEINGDTLYAESFVPFLNDGRGAYLWLTASPLYDSDGQIVGAIESVRDVTYRKKSEEALRASEQRFRRLIETMNDGLVLFDAQGIITYTNQSCCSLLGHLSEEVLGTSVGCFLPELTAGESLESWEGWQLGCGQAVEMEIKRKDGSCLPLRLSMGHICDSKGRFSGGMAILSDMTPIRQAEDRIRALNLELEQKVIDGTQELLATNKALSRSEERYRRIIESLREGYIFYSQDSAGNFTYVSPSFRNILGYRKLSQFSRCLREWLDNPLNQEAKANFEKSKLGYRQSPCDLQVERKDGTRIILEIQESPVFDRDGVVISVEGLCRDVTENRRQLELIRKAQQQLIESEKLAALGSLVAGLSHEINTPVGIGVTAASHLVQETRSCLNAYQGDRLTRAGFESFLDAANKSAALVQTNLNRAADLLQNFKLVATDQTAGQEREFNLSEYLTDVIQSLSPRFRNTGFKISSDCPDDLEMHCDPGALYQVISNLVMNSLTHGFEGMLVGEISIIARKTAGRIELEYRDTGNGMSSKNLARIYEPFFTTKRGRGGTGLGMHIVYNNVTQMLGGSISCASKPGRGTRFIISVPLLVEVEHG
jgi:PAS domain S-box-containing protein